MNVLFIFSVNEIQSPTKLVTRSQMQFGISYISSFLKMYGHNTKLIVLSRFLGKRNKFLIEENLKNFKPQLICFTAVTTEYPFIADIARYIKECSAHIYLLVGGPHVSLSPENILSDGFDAVCIGEGEHSTLELATQLEKGISPSKIPNLWIKRGGEIEKNSTRPFLENLDSLPLPDREMWHEFTDTRDTRDVVLLGRGCPFDCSYCSNHALRKLATGNYVRFRMPDNIVDEIKYIINNESVKEREIYLEVESFTINKEWAKGVCLALEQFNKTLATPLSFGVNIRIVPRANFEDIFSAMKKANFRFINIGVESGSERVRRQILRRIYSNEDVIRTVNLARSYDLKVCFFNLIGVPTETLEDFKETVKN